MSEIAEYFSYGVIVSFAVAILCWLWCALSCGRTADDAADRLAETLLRKEER